MVYDLNNDQLELFTSDSAIEDILVTTNESMAHHGIALEIFGKGVVIIGKSGVGKSEIGLELIDRGHRLICDDLVEGTKFGNEIILSSPQEFGLGFMEVRGIGFVNAEYLFGKDILCKNLPLFLVIKLVDNDMLDIINQDRLKQLVEEISVLGKTFPMYLLPIGANRNLPILVELIVKYATAKSEGYDSHEAFINGQSNFIQGSSE